MKRILVIGLLVASWVSTEGQLVVAQEASKCAAGEVEVPDDRHSGDVLCMSEAELKKAAEICKKHGSDNPMECVCQDGDSVGACGD